MGVEIHIGRALVKSAQEHYHARGYDWTSLGVSANNAGARKLCDRLGFSKSYLFLGKRLR